MARELTGLTQGRWRSEDGPATYLLDKWLAGPPRETLLTAVQACIAALSHCAAPSAREVYVDTVALTVLQPGDSIAWHADNCERDASGQWRPNACAQRCLSAVLYLNDDFGGGEIVFDRQNLRIKPRSGQLIAFPSDHLHPHCVQLVTSGLRHAMGIWFTEHRWHAVLPGRYRVDLSPTQPG